MKTSTQHVKRSNLSHALTERLMDLIRSEHYQPGDRLPPIMEMARQFGVGHPTLREVLRKLEMIGMLEIRHGSGVYIKRDRDMMLVFNPVFGETATKKLLLDLLDARMSIEITTAELAARNREDSHLERMDDLLETAGENLDNDELLNPTNLSFHCAIASASANTVLAHVLEALMGLFADEHRVIQNIFSDRKKDLEEHRAILVAIRNGDEALARERMKTHLEGVRNVLSRWSPPK